MRRGRLALIGAVVWGLVLGAGLRVAAAQDAVPVATVVPTVTLVPVATLAAPAPTATAIQVAATAAVTAVPTATGLPVRATTGPVATPTWVIFVRPQTPAPTPTPSPSPTPPRTTPTAAPTSAARLFVLPTLGSSPTPGLSRASGPLIGSVAVSGVTRGSATITWTTTDPSTSQVDFGTDPSRLAQSALEVTPVLSHRVVLADLLPDTTYQVRARSGAAAGGGLTVSEPVLVRTLAANRGPTLTDVDVRRVTATTASLSWSTLTGSAALLEVGPTASYGTSTLMEVFHTVDQELRVSNLSPATTYHVRVKAWDSAGDPSASPDLTFTTATRGPSTLLGEPRVGSQVQSLAAGQATAFQVVAARSGQAARLRLYVEPATAATGAIRVAVYADLDGAPGLILTQASAPRQAGWVNVVLPPVSLVAERRYWVAVLNPPGAPPLDLRDGGVGPGAASVQSGARVLAAFPEPWLTGQLGVAPLARTDLSVVIEQLPPAITLLGPPDGSPVRGPVQLTALVDDDVPVGQVQFVVDGLPLGAALTAAPYQTSWNPAGARPGPHTVTVRAFDLAGRPGQSNTLTVVVQP